MKIFYRQAMVYLVLLTAMAWTGGRAYGQLRPVFDHGNNDVYTPFRQFAVPVANPTPAGMEPPAGRLSNMEKDIAAQPVKAATAGIHFAPGTAGAKTVRYDLFVTDSMVDFSGRRRRAIAVNGQLLAPTLVFTIGDTALIYVHNASEEPTAVHWHGVQLLNQMDGVAYLTQHPIPPHTTYIYKFPVVQADPTAHPDAWDRYKRLKYLPPSHPDVRIQAHCYPLSQGRCYPSACRASYDRRLVPDT